jgi:hypothetical protein
MNKDTEKQNTNTEARELELFIQGEELSEIHLVVINDKSTFATMVESLASKVRGDFVDVATSQDYCIMLEDESNELPIDQPLGKLGIKHRDRLHIHRCRKIKVTVNFNGRQISESLPPSTTVGKVKKWADKHFEIDKIDATEHALQLCGTARRPDEDIHIGALVKKLSCSLCFDLVPKKRVEGASIK